MTSVAYSMSIETFVPALRTLSRLLDKAAAHAAAKSLDPAVLVEARLAPDMYPLTSQVRLACHHAEDCVARLLGQDAPSVEGSDKTLEEMKARIDRTVAHLEKAPPASFEGAEKRNVVMPLVDPLVFEADGLSLLRDWSLPHFYFHLVTAYDILRHNGVDLGKRDYLSHAGRHIHPRRDRSAATAR
jgi:uncharacterized protein